MSPAPPTSNTAALTPEQLAAAFAEFMRASEALTQSYAQLETQARRLTERLDVLMQALPVGVVVLDERRVVAELNAAAKHLAGAWLQVGATWETFRQRLQPTETPGEWRLSGESPRRLAMSEVPLPQQNGALLVLQDVSEAHRLREEMARQARLAAMGELVAALAHQLRTPLAAAMLFLDNAMTPSLAEGMRDRALQRARERLQRMERLIADMLVFARGGIAQRQPIDAWGFWQQVLSLYEPIAAAQGVRFERLAEPSPPSPALLGDERALLGAVGNLIDNALQVQHGQPGAWVGVGMNTTAEGWTLTVADRGPGMDEATRARIFAPFFTTRPDGTGLGLAIAREIITAHGGTIELVTAPGQGARFTVRLPAGKPGAEGTA